MPEHVVWNGAPAATCITLHPALQSFMPLPSHNSPTALTCALQLPLALAQIYPLVTGKALLPAVPGLALCFTFACCCFALSAALRFPQSLC